MVLVQSSHRFPLLVSGFGGGVVGGKMIKEGKIE